MKKLYFIMAMFLMLAGCSMLSIHRVESDVSICDTISDEESILCRIAAEKGVKLETVGKYIKITNIGMIVANRYTTKQAQKFVDGIIKDVKLIPTDNISITARQMAEYIVAKKALFDPIVIAAFDIVDPDLLSTSIEVDTPFKSKDIEIVLKFLEQVNEEIRSYIW